MPIVKTMDKLIIVEARHAWFYAGRGALFTVYFWFGLLKVLGLSPASPLVAALLARTFPGADPATFLVWFGAFECAIGILFLVPRLSRLTLAMMAAHMLTTFLPLILLPRLAWTAPFVPTLEGQYIIKNLLILALAIGLAARVKPLSTKER